MAVLKVLQCLVPRKLTPRVLLNLLFAFLAIMGQVGVNVSLPLWTGATQANCGQTRNSSNGTNGTDTSGGRESMTPYFVLSFVSLSSLIISGCITLVLVVLKLIVRLWKADFNMPAPLNISREDLKFPQWQFALIGTCSALNGLLVVAASLPDRTAPFLQAILGNLLIPVTIIFRFIILRHKPTLLKLSCAFAIVFALILCFIPIISGTEEGNDEWLKQSRVARALWTFCFMIAFMPVALMNVIEEKSLKDTRMVNLFFLLFMASIYQVITVANLFWTDIIPGFGYSDGFGQFGQNFWFALKCFFGHADCNYTPGLRGSMFVVMFTVAYISGGLLIRYAEGATYLAIVQALVTPLGALFWSLFQAGECGRFSWGPHADSLTYFSIGGIAIMVPAIYFYNIGAYDQAYQRCICYCIDYLYPVHGRHDDERNDDERNDDGELGNRNPPAASPFAPTVQYTAESGDDTTPLLLHDTSNN